MLNLEVTHSAFPSVFWPEDAAAIPRFSVLGALVRGHPVPRVTGGCGSSAQGAVLSQDRPVGRSEWPVLEEATNMKELRGNLASGVAYATPLAGTDSVVVDKEGRRPTAEAIDEKEEPL